MSAYDIDPGVRAAIADFRLPERLGFGDINAPVMFQADWRDGAWQRGLLRPYGPIEVWPGSRALQYAELVFEGLKAYRVERRRPNFFRADANCRRMMRSAARLSMPTVPEELFFQGITAVTQACSEIMPTQCSELFACGTAAIVSGIALLADGDGREYVLRETDVLARHLRESLLAIQERRAPDPFGWTQDLAAA